MHAHIRILTGALACGLLATACGGMDGPGSGEDTPEPTTSGDSAATELPATEPGAGCGDGVVDPGEGCDEGAANGASAACTPACQPAACGDGFVATSEQCDDGNLNDADGCTATCTLPSCGDGMVSNGEACDDGDDDNSDACLVGCKLAFCGDSYVREDSLEQCDDGDQDNSDGCLMDCTVATCGDGYVHEGVEICDDGDDDNSDGCLVGCMLAVCGDGYVYEGVEACDDGNAVDDDGCAADCMSPATCSDGKQNGEETDVDCGGPNCMGCGDDAMCDDGSDCSSTFCDHTTCVSPRHCRDIRDLDLAKPDGVYPVDPDGSSGEAAPVAVFCEMTFNGGGWTALFNMRELPVGEASAEKFLAALSTNAPAEPVMPNSNSVAVYTGGLALGQFTEALFGWGPSTQTDITRYAKLTNAAGLSGLCYLDGYCGPGVDVGTFDLVPTGSTRILRSGKATDFPHVGLGFDDQTIVWGYDRNAAHLNNWANLYDQGACCKAGNTPDINVPGWRYAIYVR